MASCIKNFEKIATTPIRQKALKIIESGLEAVDNDKVVLRNVKLCNGKLNIRNKYFNLQDYKRIFVIGFGKCAGAHRDGNFQG